MLHIHKKKLKKGIRYQAQVRIGKISKAKTFNTKIEARFWGVEMENFLDNSVEIIYGKTLFDAFKRYSYEVSITKKGRRWEQIRLKRYMRENISDILLLNITAKDLEFWIEKELLRNKPGSVRRDITLIFAVFKIALEKWKWIDKNPFEKIKIPKTGPPRDRRISNIEIALILENLKYSSEKKIITRSDFLAVGFLLALETAMRQGEIWKIKWQDVFLSEQYLKLYDTKNGSNRDVPLSKKAVQIFQQIGVCKTGLIFTSNQASGGQLFRETTKQCKIKNLTFHDTRHESLTQLAKKLSVLELARMVGHKDLKSLMIYFNATASELATKLD